jgi:hypothetical protein
VSRQFVVFADPPVTAPQAVPPAIAALPPAPVTTTGGVPTQSRPAAASTTRAKADKTQAGTTSTAAAQSRAAKTLSVAPRLKLEEPEALLHAANLAVATQGAALASATQAASAAQAVALSAEQRMVALEQKLQDMHADAASHRAATEQMRLRLGQADNQNRMVWALLAVAVGLAGCRLAGPAAAHLQREQRAGWWRRARRPRPRHCHRMRQSRLCPWSMQRFCLQRARRPQSLRTPTRRHRPRMS